MSITEAIRQFFCPCPHLPAGVLTVNYLPPEPPAFSILAKGDGTIKRYADGGALRYFDFALCGRLAYGGDSESQEAAANTFEQVARWTVTESQKGSFPPLGEGRRACALEIAAAAKVADNSPKTARYELSCRLIYLEGGENHG